MGHKTNSAEGSFSSHSVQNNHTEGSCSWKNRVQRLDIRLSGNLGSKRTSSGMETSCPSGLLCVRNPESKGKAGGPWTHRWHGPTKTHLCRRENVPASEMARWPSQKPPMPTCHDMTWHANVTTRHDGYHFISFHPLHYGVYQSVSFMHPDLWQSAGEAWWCVRRGYQVTRINPDIMLPEASSAQASRVRTSIQKTPSGDWMLFRINPESTPE